MKTHLCRNILFPLLAFSIVFVVVMIVSCQKTQNTSSPRSESNEELNTQLMNSTNFASQNENLDDQDFNDMIASDNMGENADNVDVSATNGCKTITYDTTKNVFPHTKTVVYNNCETCKGGPVNGAKTTTKYVDPETAQPGDLLSETTYENLTIDNVKVAGDVKTYLVSNSPKTLHIVTTRTFVIPGRDGTTETFKGDNTRTQIAGEGTNDNSDDVYAITGTASGHENLHGGGTVAKYTSIVDTNDPLISEHGCCWRTQGTETITLNVKVKGSESTLTEVLDYGDGECDNEGTLTINGGEPQSVTLPLIFYPLVP